MKTAYMGGWPTIHFGSFKAETRWAAAHDSGTVEVEICGKRKRLPAERTGDGKVRVVGGISGWSRGHWGPYAVVISAAPGNRSVVEHHRLPPPGAVLASVSFGDIDQSWVSRHKPLEAGK